MATFKMVRLNQKRDVEKFPLYVKVYNEKKSDFINTGFYVTKDAFDKNGSLKDRHLRVEIEQKIMEYEGLIRQKFGIDTKVQGDVLCRYIKKELRIKGEIEKDGEIDYFVYFKKVIQKMEENGRENPASNYRVTLNHLKDYQKSDTLSFEDLTTNYIKLFLEDVRQKCQKKGFEGKRCVALTFSTMRSVFNQAMLEYNDKEKGIIRIKTYPFKDIEIKQSFSTRIRSVDAEVIRTILACDGLNSIRNILARDYLLLSFGLGGINGVDLYFMKPENYVRGRLNYNRHKTKSTRQDNAYMSIRVPDELVPIFDKYADTSGKRLFNFYKRYGKHKNFIRGVNNGLKYICSILDLPVVTTYSIRHTVADIASNSLYIPTSDIALLLNHASAFKMTEIYTTRSFRKVDEINRLILDWVLYGVFNPLKPKISPVQNVFTEKKNSVQKILCNA